MAQSALLVTRLKIFKIKDRYIYYCRNGYMLLSLYLLDKKILFLRDLTNERIAIAERDVRGYRSYWEGS